jgi:hypothetical protein
MWRLVRYIAIMRVSKNEKGKAKNVKLQLKTQNLRF